MGDADFRMRRKDLAMKNDPAMASGKGSGAPRFVSGLLLAAGACRRMHGEDKLLREVAGEPLLRRMARCLLAAPLGEVIVTLPPEHEARRSVLEGLNVVIVPVPDCAEGMAASIRAGIGALSPRSEGVLLALADMPALTQAHLVPLLDAFEPEAGAAICRPTSASGAPGHPVLFSRRFFPELAALKGDRGARALLARHPDLVRGVPMPDDACTLDLDTPDAWREWERSRTGEER